MRRVRFSATPGLVLLLAIALPPLAGCGGPAGPSRAASSLMLVTIDTVRADHMGAYGGPPGASPAFDRLASEGVLFEQCDSPSPLTLPAHASLLTGLEPAAHGLRANGGGRLPPAVTPIAALLQDAGWRTAAFVSSAVLDRATGLDRGFDLYDDRVRADGERRGDRTTDLALAWLEARGPAPWFLWVHLYDAHAPYDPPPSARSRFPTQAYRAEIAFVDEQLRRLLAAVEQNGSAVRIVVVADHGEGLGEHGEREHGLLLYQSTLHVPLVVAGPGLPVGRRVTAPVRSQDLFATLVELAGRTPPANGPTAPLPGLLGPEVLVPAARMQRSETLLPMLDYGWQPLVSAREGRFKLLRGTYDELFDLAADPGEQDSLLDASHGAPPAAAAGLARDRLGRALDEEGRRLRERVRRPPGTGTGTTVVSDPDLLRSLGYLGGTTSESAGEGAPSGSGGSRVRADPRHRVGWHETVADILAAYRSGHYEEGLARLLPLLREEPDNPLLTDLAGSLLVALDRPGEAAARYEAVLARLPGRAAVRLHLAEALLKAGQRERAVTEARRAITDGVARRSRAALVLCEALAGLGRADEARAGAAALLPRIPPDDPLRPQVAACAGGQ